MKPKSSTRAPSRTRTKGSAKPPRDPDLAKLPPAVRARAEALQSAAQKKLLREARAALSSAKFSLRQTEVGYYEAGRAIAILAKPGMSEVLGYGSVFELCKTEFELGRDAVERLLKAVAHVDAEQYANLKSDRVDALIELAQATEADDTEAILDGKKITLWKGGPRLDVAKTANAGIREAAKQVRDHREDTGERTKPRGRTVSAAERSLVQRATKLLQSAGRSWTVRVRATKPGKASVFDIVGLDATTFEAMLKWATKR